MDWARDDFGLSDIDLENVFQYEQKQTTVIKLVESRGYRAQVWTLRTHDQWLDWIANEVQSIHNTERGFVLVLSKRAAESTTLTPSGPWGLPIEEWLAKAETQKQQSSKLHHTYTLGSLNEKQADNQEEESPIMNNGRRDVRTLSFDLDTFKLLACSFHTHGSIARVISRADVPFFSCESALMTEPAYVYNARSSNVWDADLALSATHFPGSGLTYSIMYGCTFEIEKSIISRLQRVNIEASHPLLLPGVFAELELARQTKLVERTINEVEAKIGELDLPASDIGRTQKETEQQNEDKRAAWLDLTYLRNAIISWNTQLDKMIDHSNTLNEKEYQLDLNNWHRPVGHVSHSREAVEKANATLGWVPHITADIGKAGDTWRNSDANFKERSPVREKFLASNYHGKKISHTARMREVGIKIKGRVLAIKDENDEKIRDCSTRVDGMAMATQWAHGETNVEIALATNRDSRVMRSIALVTMVFLPGTFFATVFSMTFFDWFGENGRTRVSKYLWIYILITIFFTFLTVGSWYFFVFYRRRYRILRDSENVT